MNTNAKSASSSPSAEISQSRLEHILSSLRNVSSHLYQEVSRTVDIEKKLCFNNYPMEDDSKKGKMQDPGEEEGLLKSIENEIAYLGSIEAILYNTNNTLNTYI